MIKNVLPLLFLLLASKSYADSRWVTPFSILHTTNTYTASPTFSSATFTGPITVQSCTGCGGGEGGNPAVATDTTTISNSVISMGWVDATLETGTTYWVRIPSTGTITSAVLTGLPAGTVSVAISTSQTFNNNPASICAPNCPTLSSDDETVDLSLTNWTKTLIKDGYLYFSLISASTVDRVSLFLHYDKKK